MMMMQLTCVIQSVSNMVANPIQALESWSAKRATQHTRKAADAAEQGEVDFSDDGIQ